MLGWFRFWTTFRKTPKTASKTATKARASDSAPSQEHSVAIPQSNLEPGSEWDGGHSTPSDAVQVEGLLRDLEAKIPAWRDRAAESLVQIGMPVVPGLLQKLSPQKELPVRQLAASVLCRIGPDAMAAVPDLIQASVDSNAGVREAAVEALKKIDPTWATGASAQRAIPGLVKTLKSRSAAVGYAAMALLSHIGALAVPELIQALGNQEDDILQTAAAQTLGRIGAKAAIAVPELTHALGSNPIHVRQAAAEALGQIGQAAAPAIPVLVQALADENPIVRQCAARSLGRIGQAVEITAPAVTQLLADNDDRVRRAAIEALTAIGPASVPLLIRLLKEHDIRHIIERLKEEEDNLFNWFSRLDYKTIRRLPLEAVKNLRWHFQFATEDYTAIVHQAAAQVLGKIGPLAHTAVPVLIKTVEDQHPTVRQTAVQALGQIGPQARAAIPSLIQALVDSNGLVREATIEALTNIDPQWPSSPAIDMPSTFVVQKLQESSEERQTAADALVLIGSHAVQALLPALAAEDRIVRQAAAEILGRMGTGAQAAIPALVRALQDSHVWVREAAAQALQKIDPENRVRT